MKIAFLTTDNREHYKDYSATAPYFGTAPEALLSGLACFPEIEVHVISCAREPMESPEKLAPNTFFHGLRVPRIGWMRTAYQGCVRAVRAKLRQIQPDIVHGQGTEYDCALNAVLSRFPNVLTLHGNMRRIARVMKARPFSFYWIIARMEAFAVARAGGVVCITNHTLREVASLAKRTWVVPNAVDESFFTVRAEPERQPTPRILCVGQVYPLKNQNALIRALDPLAAKHRFELVFLGDAKQGQPYADEFLALIQSRPWCVHPGFAEREELKGYLRTATLLVQPTLEDNCPMAVLEALAAGVPVLAAKVGGLPDLVEEGKTGLFCNPVEPASITAGVERFLAQPSTAREMGIYGKQRAKERFHPDVVANRHLEIYREVLNKPS